MNTTPDWKRAFEEKTIQMRTSLGTTKNVDSLCIGCWAVHYVMNAKGEIIQKFMITNIPTGSSIPAFFEDQESACRAATDIHRLRNDWPIVTMQECEQKADIRNAVCKAILDHDGKIVTNLPAASHKHVPNNLNGYDDSEVDGRG